MNTFARLTVAALALGACAASIPAQAATFDAFTSFTGASDVAGQFSFGSYNPTNAIFSLYGGANCTQYIGGADCRGALPGVYKTNSGAHQSGTVLVPADALILHPGNGTNGLQSAILFTAADAGTYSFSLSAFQSDTGSRSQTVGFLTQGLGTYSLGGVITLTTASPTYSTSILRTLAAGETFGISVGNDNGDYSNDSTGINFGATAVPEPASWALMLGGFGVIGATMRSSRRRSTAFA